MFADKKFIKKWLCEFNYFIYFLWAGRENIREIGINLKHRIHNRDFTGKITKLIWIYLTYHRRNRSTKTKIKPILCTQCQIWGTVRSIHRNSGQEQVIWSMSRSMRFWLCFSWIGRERRTGYWRRGWWINKYILLRWRKCIINWPRPLKNVNNSWNFIKENAINLQMYVNMSKKSIN